MQFVASSARLFRMGTTSSGPFAPRSRSATGSPTSTKRIGPRSPRQARRGDGRGGGRAHGLQSGEAIAWGDVVEHRAPGCRVRRRWTRFSSTRRRTARHVTRSNTHAAEPVRAKGKARPIRVWLPSSPRARRGIDLSQASRGPLVGRSKELSLLLESLERVERQRSPELVTLVGDAGIGKSRLVFELFREVELGSGLRAWRQARSSPYGDGFAFWALGEIVKAHAGILETDTSLGRLGQAPSNCARPRPFERPTPPGSRVTCSSLVGVGAAAKTGDQRQAAFAAWRHFLEAVAERYPLVLVFEDIHWADKGLLDFIEDLLDWARDVRILVVCTARPELADARPGWGERIEDFCDDGLLAALGERDRASWWRSWRAGSSERGNGEDRHRRFRQPPLRSRVRTDARGSTGQALAVPEYGPRDHHGPPGRAPGRTRPFFRTHCDRKGCLAGSARPRRRPVQASVDRHLEALERKEFLVRARPSSVAGEAEFRFRHVLVRDVAYGQIPRRGAEIHRRTAEWLESLSPDRAADRAEMLAHHYLHAYELALASGADTASRANAPDFPARGRRPSIVSVRVSAASRYFRAALALWKSRMPSGRGCSCGWASRSTTRTLGGADVLADAERSLLAAGDQDSAAEAAMYLADLAYVTANRTSGCSSTAYRALTLVDSRGPSPSKVDVLLDLAVLLTLVAEHEQAIDDSEKRPSRCGGVGAPRIPGTSARDHRGSSRGLSGDPDGRTDLDGASRSPRNRFSVQLPPLRHARRSRVRPRQPPAVLRAAGEGSWTRGALRPRRPYRVAQGGGVAEGYWTGNWDEALGLADEFLAGPRLARPFHGGVLSRHAGADSPGQG